MFVQGLGTIRPIFVIILIHKVSFEIETVTNGRIFVTWKGCARDYVAFSICFLQIYSLELAVTRPFFHLSVHIRDSTPPLLIGILTIYKVSKDCRLGVHFVGLNLPKGPEIASSVNFRASAIHP